MSKKILVVDDNFGNLAAAEEQLGADYYLTTVPTFEEAQKLLKEDEWDVVMTDVMMPGEKDGQGKGLKLVGEMMPIGLVVALLALQKGVPEIFILSDTNHHDHPVAWAMDSIVGPGPINGFTGYKCPMNDDGTKNWQKALAKDWSY